MSFQNGSGVPFAFSLCLPCQKRVETLERLLLRSLSWETFQVQISVFVDFLKLSAQCFRDKPTSFKLVVCVEKLSKLLIPWLRTRG